MDGFVNLTRDLLCEGGAPPEFVFLKGDVELPGYFRPTKEWDLVVVQNARLLASIEFKSQVGPSFGNNYNNRTEEALGSAQDLWTAFREGKFESSPKPWLGYLMMLEETRASTSPVRVREPHFEVFPEFEGASYARRYEVLCDRLVKERLYDGSCLILSSGKGGLKGEFREPVKELSFERFVRPLVAHVTANLA